MKTPVLAIVAISILFPFAARSDCRISEVEGDWLIFFVDASISDKHVRKDTELHVKFVDGNFDVDLKKSNGWKVEDGSEDFICYNNGDVTVTATIKKGHCEHKLSLYRVTDYSDLRSRPDGTKKMNQIEFDQYRHEKDCSDHKSAAAVANADEAKPYIYAEVHEDDIHPGHIHGDKD